MTLIDSMTDDESEWLRVRKYLEGHRFDLGEAAVAEFPDHLRVGGTPLLSTAHWVPSEPIDLRNVVLSLSRQELPCPTSKACGAAIPSGRDGRFYENYSDVYQALAAPRTFQNRSTYRLIGAQLSEEHARLSFALGRYFDSLNTGEASAHAFAASMLESDAGSIRKTFNDPCDIASRPANLALSALTIRYDPVAETASFFLHWRDPKKVGHAGGLYQVVPSGVFQASGEEEWNQENDFSFIRFLARELAEELGGRSERYDNSDSGIVYEQWPFFHTLNAGLISGSVRAWCVGLGVDPLTFATDLLAVLVFDASLFDELFTNVAGDNEEGIVSSAKPFVEEEIQGLLSDARIQAAGAAILSCAWQHRQRLLPGINW